MFVKRKIRKPELQEMKSNRLFVSLTHTVQEYVTHGYEKKEKERRIKRESICLEESKGESCVVSWRASYGI